MNKDIPIGDDTIDIINEVAKQNPAVLAKALRQAGNFCYLIVPEDILNYDDYQYEGKLNITSEEAIKVISEFGQKISDEMPYGELCQSITERILTVRKCDKSWDTYRNNG
jgi:hypothetical protein